MSVSTNPLVRLPNRLCRWLLRLPRVVSLPQYFSNSGTYTTSVSTRLRNHLPDHFSNRSQLMRLGGPTSSFHILFIVALHALHPLIKPTLWISTTHWSPDHLAWFQVSPTNCSFTYRLKIRTLACTHVWVSLPPHAKHLLHDKECRKTYRVIPKYSFLQLLEFDSRQNVTVACVVLPMNFPSFLCSQHIWYVIGYSLSRLYLSYATFLYLND